MNRIQRAVAFLFLLPAAIAGASAQSKPVVIRVDATQASIGLLHSHFVFPAAPGPKAIAYPKWIPGEHAPTGPINQIVHLCNTVGDCIRAKRLECCRNDLANPRLRSKTITEIAFSWCFSDSAHTSAVASAASSASASHLPRANWAENVGLGE
jgi:hypothetical protein